LPGIPRKRLIGLCRSLATMLDAGLPVSRALSVLSSQGGPGWLRSALKRARRAVDEGATLAEAFEAQGRFPRLFIMLVRVGEESGTLERVLHELARFYEFRQGLRRGLLAQVALPLIQYVAAVAVVALATHIKDQPSTALRCVVLGYGLPVAAAGAYALALRPLGAARLVHEAVLRVPVLGGVVRHMALARFSLILSLTLEAAVPIAAALRHSFEGTGNAAFAARAGGAAAAVEEGATLTEAVAGTGLFPVDYLAALEVAEESGKVPERLDWLASRHREQAEFAMRGLAKALGWAVYVAVAAFIIYYIFKFFQMYAGAIQGAAG